MSDEAADDAPASFFLEGLEDLSGYTQQPPATPDELYALLESLKQRLIVPAERVAEFEAAARAAGLDGRLVVVGHPWLKPDQVFLAQSEAEFEADMQAAVESGRAKLLAALEAETAARMAALREQLAEEARRDWVLAYLRARPSVLPAYSPFRGPFGLGDLCG